MIGILVRRCALGAIAAALALAPCGASAFVSFGNGLGSKWGPNPVAGTPAIVTWGFMNDGVTVDPSFVLDPFSFPGQTGLSGTSNIGSLRSRIDGLRGAGAFNAAIQRAFATWSEVTNITFVGPINDLGFPFPAPAALAPDIRIGAFTPQVGHSFNNVAAVGFGPPGFGPDPLAGDVLFNLSANIDIVAGVEDVTPLPAFTNDLEGLFLHELGHAAIGLGHPSWEGENPDRRVMYVGDFGNPSAPACCQSINRELHPDDVAGAIFTYGARGDFNADARVDNGDLDLLLGSWGSSVVPPTWATFVTPPAIDNDELDSLLLNWGVGTGGIGTGTSASVPEPAMATLAALALVAFGGRGALNSGSITRG